MKFIQKKLVSDNDLQEYSENYYKIILVKLDLEFLRGRDVYGFYGDHGGMIGGYTINNRPPYRILKLIPEDLEEGRKFQETYAGEFSELIAMWKASRSKRRNRQRETGLDSIWGHTALETSVQYRGFQVCSATVL
jgi:hypothetical protein